MLLTDVDVTSLHRIYVSSTSLRRHMPAGLTVTTKAICGYMTTSHCADYNYIVIYLKAPKALYWFHGCKCPVCKRSPDKTNQHYCIDTPTRRLTVMIVFQKTLVYFQRLLPSLDMHM